jgi:hypothetical protein
VKQYTPKLSPDIVTLPVPVRTAFGGSEKLAAGAARESIRHNQREAIQEHRTIEGEGLGPCANHPANCQSFSCCPCS